MRPWPTDSHIPDVKSSSLMASLRRPAENRAPDFAPGGGVISLSDFELGVTLGTESFGRLRIWTHK
eukprot:15150-Eustigmatos_ZCMA.PRE.1